MRKALLAFLLCLGLLGAFIRFAATPIAYALGDKPKTGLKITSAPEAVVYLDNQKVGNTPYSDDTLVQGQHQVKLVSDQGSWEGSVSLNSGTESVINRELGQDIATASGETLSLVPGGGAAIVTTPDGVDVEIDGKDYGKSPLTLTGLGVGEHTFVFSKDQYLKRTIQAQIPSGTELEMSVDLAIIPDINAANLFSTNTEPVKVVVKSTPTGFLRVRDNPSLDGKEIGKVYTGDQLSLVDQEGDWDKIRLDNGSEGFVYSTYLETK